MLNKISFKNYKAFTEGEIKIKPITILLGANSVGKSSIMQLLLLLQQTALSESNYKSALKLHGGFVSLGEGLNLIRKKDVSKVLTIELDFYNASILKELKEDYFASFIQDFIYFSNLLTRVYGKKNNALIATLKRVMGSSFEDPRDITLFRKSSKELGQMFDEKSFFPLVEDLYKIVIGLDKKELAKEFEEDFFLLRHTRYRMGGAYFNHFKILKERKEEYFLTFSFLNNLIKDIDNGHFRVSYDVVCVDKTLLLKKIAIYNEQNELLSIEFDTHSSSGFKLNNINSRYINKEHFKEFTLQSVREIFVNPRTIFSFINNSEPTDETKMNKSIFSFFLKYLLNNINTITSDYFENDNINYVSPLRAHPKRYYFLDKAKINAYVDTLDGDAIAEILKENSDLKNQVNNWLQKFNLNVKVDQMQDIIHKLIVQQNSLDLDITDVGFGISQVLPVIIQGFLSHDNSITLIEQPEIHLHPKMQGELADLFIDIVLAKRIKHRYASKYLLIETHSEYLLKRLRRRMSEGIISPDDVAIYLIDPEINDSGAIIRELSIKSKGDFEWPLDFYGGELLKDTTEFIKNQRG